MRFLIAALIVFISMPAHSAQCIGDRVWHDADGDGVQGDYEGGVAGVSVRIVDDAGVTVDEMRTNHRGYFGLCGDAGVYTLQVDIPAGYTATTPDQGGTWRQDYDDSDIDALGLASVRIRATRRQNLHDVGLVTSDDIAPDEPEPEVEETVAESPVSATGGVVLHIMGQSNALPAETLLAPGIDRIVTARSGVPIQLYSNNWWPRHVPKLASLPADARNIVVWIQGEAEAAGIYPYEYLDEQNRLFDAITTAIPNVEILDVTLNEAVIYGGPGDRRNTRARDHVNAAKRKIASERSNVTLIGGDYDLRDDGLHYTALGYEQMTDDVLGYIGTDATEPVTQSITYGLAASFTRAGDMNGDGIEDAVIGTGAAGHEDLAFVAWFDGATGERNDIATSGLEGYIGDAAVADIDGDGDLDVAFGQGAWRASDTETGTVGYYENRGSQWVRRVIRQNLPGGHYGEIRAADLEGDGDIDIVVRHIRPALLRIYRQEGGRWTEETQSVVMREGLDLADIDRDGLLDIIGNGWVLFQGANGWTSRNITSDWIGSLEHFLDNSTKSAAADINGDGRLDLVFASAEGKRLPMKWFAAPANPRTGPWIETTIDTVASHQVLTTDVDNDGDIDLIGGESWGAGGRMIWLNDGQGEFTRQNITTGAQEGCYNCDLVNGYLVGPTTFAGPVLAHELP